MADISRVAQDDRLASVAGIDSKTKIGKNESASKLEPSLELAHLLGSLQNALDIDDDSNKSYEDSLDLANKESSDSINHNIVLSKDLQKKLTDLTSILSANPSKYGSPEQLGVGFLGIP